MSLSSISSDWKKNYSLKIEQVPSYPFIHSFFEITIDLIDDQSGLLKCGEEIPIDVKLFALGEDKSSNLELECSDPKISITGFTKLKIKILEPSMRFDNSELFLEVSTKNSFHSSISSARSEGMFAVSHQLVIDGGCVPKSWYKDRGGKDSFIEIGVSMISSTKKLVTHRRVPLKVLLLYENEEQVANQNILTHSSDTKLQIDATGRTYIRFRIGEVSRNHQKQSFCLKIGPDTNQYPLNNDISPALSDCVEVLSKPRSSKDKKNDDSTVNGKRKGMTEPDDDDFASKKERSAPTNFPGAPVPCMESSGITALLTAHSLATTNINGIQSNINVSTGESPTGNGMNDDNVTIQEQNNRRHDAQHAFSDLMTWTKMVMDELLQLKWRQVGLERMVDGSMEPLVVRKNPNLAIDDLVMRYNEYAVPNMRMLYKDMFHIDDDSVIPNTLVRSEAFEEAQGHSFDELPPPNAPKMGMQHSLMSNPDDWPSVVFTPSVVEDLMTPSDGKDDNNVKMDVMDVEKSKTKTLSTDNDKSPKIPILKKKGETVSDDSVEILE